MGLSKEAETFLWNACKTLEKKGVESLRVPYEGSGDSGCIEGIEYYPDDSDYEGRKELDYKLVDCFHALLPSGFEINDGSFGGFEIDLTTLEEKEGKIEIEINHTWRTTEDDSRLYTLKEPPKAPEKKQPALRGGQLPKEDE